MAGDELTTGADSRLQAIVKGLAPDLQSPAGKSLLATYLAWQQAQKAEQERATTRTAEEVEARARKRGHKRIVKSLQVPSTTVDEATARGFEQYRAEGGLLSLTRFRKAAVGDQ
jgi:hypothetical protein